MVFFTLFATIDSVTLLVAMTGTLISSAGSLKAIADLEHDHINSSDFVSHMKIAHRAELGFLAVNVLAVLPFIGSWWMAIPQVAWAAIKGLRSLSGGHVLDEKEVFKPQVYQHHRKWHMAGLFVYLISWFFYLARAVTAVMDIHIHGISPYD